MCVVLQRAKYVGHVPPFPLTQPYHLLPPHLQVRAHTIIMATGATALKLGLPSEQTFWAKGISACAICDGEGGAWAREGGAYGWGQGQAAM